MATYSNVVGNCGYVVDDHTHGSVKDGDSTRSKYVLEGGDVDRMPEHTFNGSRIEVKPGPTNLKGSWNPSADIVDQPTAFFPHGAAPSEPTVVQKVIARLKEAGINLYSKPDASASGLADILVKGFYNTEITNPGGGHDVLLILAECIADLNDSM